MQDEPKREPLRPEVVRAGKGLLKDLPTWALIAILAALTLIDTVNPVDLPLFIDEIVIGGPALLAATELFARWKKSQG